MRFIRGLPTGWAAGYVHDLRTDELAVEQPVKFPQRESVSIAKCKPLDEPVREPLSISFVQPVVRTLHKQTTRWFRDLC